MYVCLYCVVCIFLCLFFVYLFDCGVVGCGEFDWSGWCIVWDCFGCCYGGDCVCVLLFVLDCLMLVLWNMGILWGGSVVIV